MTPKTSENGHARPKPGYIVLPQGENSAEARQKALTDLGQALSQALGETRGRIGRAHASAPYLNIGPGSTSIRDGFARRDYEDFRQDESIPKTPKGRIRAALEAYKNVELIRHVIDMMSDFTIQGIDVVNSVKSAERFMKGWFKRVRGRDRSERMASMLYRACNVIGRRDMEVIPPAEVRRMRRAQAAEPDITPREIPSRYYIFNPLTIDLVAEDVATVIGPEWYRFEISIPRTMASKLANPSSDAEREMVGALPADVRARLRSSDGAVKIPLPADRTFNFYFKKDDSEPWADPFLGAILPDLVMLEKLRLADLAALDGAVSSVRVWKLGNLEYEILPNAAMIQQLAETLNANVGGGVIDLIWDPAIELVETKSESYKFLGDAKYAHCMSAIYAGLGVPPTLTGSAEKAGMSNNWISLKTLTEKLKYGRQVITEFWENEFEIVRRAMGFRRPSRLVFDRMVLDDDAAHRALLIDMADRGLVSVETLQERFGETPEVERVRIRREQRLRDRKRLPPLAGPFREDTESKLKGIFAQSGAYAPSQFGLELGQKVPAERTPLGEQSRLNPRAAPGSTLKGEPGQGRPKNSKDSKQRKRPSPAPRGRSVAGGFREAYRRAGAVLGAVSDLTLPAYLQSLGKEAASLTGEEWHSFYEFLFAAASRLEGEVTRASLLPLLSSPLAADPYCKTLADAAVALRPGIPPAECLKIYQSTLALIWAA